MNNQKANFSSFAFPQCLFLFRFYCQYKYHTTFILFILELLVPFTCPHFLFVPGHVQHSKLQQCQEAHQLERQALNWIPWRML